MKRAVLYGKDKKEKEKIIDYLAEQNENLKKVNGAVSHLYPVNIGYINHSSDTLSLNEIHLMKDYESKVPNYLRNIVSTILINSSIAEKIHEVCDKKSGLNGYDKILDELIYDDVYVLDNELLLNTKKETTLNWFKVNGAHLISVPQGDLFNKADYIFDKSFANANIRNPYRTQEKKSDNNLVLDTILNSGANRLGYY